MDRLAVQQHLPSLGRQQAREGAQQRGLAAGVRPDNDGDPPGRHGKVQPVEDACFAVPGGKAGGEEGVRFHREPPDRLTRTIRKIR